MCLGLTEQESQAYLAALKLGTAKVSDIAKKSGSKREATYYTLKLLQERGFLSEVIKSGVKYYSATPPARLLELLEEEKQSKAAALQEVLPQLEGLARTALARPTVEVYEGVEGFKTVVARLVEHDNQEVLAYVPESTLHFMPAFHLQFRRKRKERQVRMRLLTEDTAYMRELHVHDTEELRRTRFLGTVLSSTQAAFFVLADAIILIKANENEQLGVYVRDPDAAQLHHGLFDALWSIAAD